MSIDNALRSIAYSETATLGAAIAQIAKRRIDLDAALRADALTEMPIAGRGAAEQRAIATVETLHRLDRTA